MTTHTTVLFVDDGLRPGYRIGKDEQLAVIEDLAGEPATV
jgi:hypothetical protein